MLWNAKECTFGIYTRMAAAWPKPTLATFSGLGALTSNLAGTLDGVAHLMKRSLPKIETPTLSACKFRHIPRTPEVNSTTSSAAARSVRGVAPERVTT